MTRSVRVGDDAQDPMRTRADRLWYYLRDQAQGKITCQCGNKEWLDFIYAGIPQAKEGLIAGCKECATTYRFIDEKWVKLSDGPNYLLE